MVQVEHVIAEVAPADKRLMALLFMKWCKRPLSRAEVKGECPDAEAECLDHVTLFSQHPLVEALAGYPGAAVHTAALVTQGAGEHERSQDREHGPSPSFELVPRGGAMLASPKALFEAIERDIVSCRVPSRHRLSTLARRENGASAPRFAHSEG